MYQFQVIENLIFRSPNPIKNMSKPRHKYNKFKIGGEISFKTNSGPKLVLSLGLFI
jgi:hypothetical protein